MYQRKSSATDISNYRPIFPVFSKILHKIFKRFDEVQNNCSRATLKVDGIFTDLSTLIVWLANLGQFVLLFEIIYAAS